MVHLRREEGVSPVSNFSWSRSKRVWKNAFGKFLKTSHGWLPTSAFQPEASSTGEAWWRGLSAQETLAERMRQLCTFSGTADFSYEYVLYGLFNCPTTHQFKICWCIINCVKIAIWKVRNIFLFNRDSISVIDCIKLAFSEMFIYFLKDFKDVGKREANRR
ncbi:unnamed protein product, partial [Ranitomeya imitator]